MSKEEKRKLYKKKQFVVLDEIETWQQQAPHILSKAGVKCMYTSQRENTFKLKNCLLSQRETTPGAKNCFLNRQMFMKGAIIKESLMSTRSVFFMAKGSKFFS